MNTPHRGKIIFITLAFFVPLFAGAQEPRPVIKINPFVSHGVSEEETRFIESLIQSYVSDAGRVAYSSDTPVDYILSGNIHRDRNNRVFTIRIHNTNSNEVSSVTSTHASTGDLVLQARSLIENAFRNHVQAAKTTPAVNGNGDEEAEIITESRIAGAWRGEAGIELIRLHVGGSGVVFFSSGAQTKADYVIKDNTIIIDAPPFHWEMQLYSGGNRLRDSSAKSSWTRSVR